MTKLKKLSSNKTHKLKLLQLKNLNYDEDDDKIVDDDDDSYSDDGDDDNNNAYNIGYNYKDNKEFLS